MMDHLTYARIVALCVVVSGSAVGGLALWVSVTYALAYMRRAPGSQWRGLLPRHVAVIGLSYLLLVAMVVIGIVSRINEPPTWRSPVYVVAFLLGLWALRDMLRLQQHRKVTLPGERPLDDR